jgi:hypothetical protein
MTRSPQLDKNVTITVICKNDKVYSKRDTVPNPYGAHGNTLTFWAETGFNELITVPLEQVVKIRFHLDDDTDKEK